MRADPEKKFSRLFRNKSHEATPQKEEEDSLFDSERLGDLEAKHRAIIVGTLGSHRELVDSRTAVLYELLHNFGLNEEMARCAADHEIAALQAVADKDKRKHRQLSLAFIKSHTSLTFNTGKVMQAISQGEKNTWRNYPRGYITGVADYHQALFSIDKSKSEEMRNAARYYGLAIQCLIENDIQGVKDNFERFYEALHKILIAK